MTPKFHYYKVVAKCGHVGNRSYVPIAFAVRAESRCAASQKVMTYRRVKKQLKDAIISCEEINKSQYKELLLANRSNDYLHCKCQRQQYEIDNFELLICKNITFKVRRKFEPAKSMKYKRFIYELGGRRNNSCYCYGEV